MLKERAHHITDLQRPGSARVSRVRTYKTAAGPLLLRSCYSPSFVEHLQADEGLRAFARLPERGHRLLLSIAQQPENRLTLAYTASGTIVGQVSLAPLDQWWQDIGNAYEIAVEVSLHWRKLGIAHHLLSLALEFETVEESVIVGLGLSWHWDYEGLGMSRFRYRELIARLFAAHGFVTGISCCPMQFAHRLLDELEHELSVQASDQRDRQAPGLWLLIR